MWRRAELLAFLVLGAVGCSGGQAPSPAKPSFSSQAEVPAAYEEVRGIFQSGGVRSSWVARFDGPTLVDIREERDLGSQGNATAEWIFEPRSVLRFREEARRRLSPVGGLAEITMEIEFEEGQFARGSKTVSGDSGEPDEHDARTAWQRAALFMEQARLTRSNPRPGYVCSGNEPFWKLTTDGRQVTYGSLSGGDTERTFEGSFQWITTVAPPRFEWRGADAGESLTAIITEERCLDTMSDETPPFPYRIRLQLGDAEPVSGCCRPARQGGRPR